MDSNLTLYTSHFRSRFPSQGWSDGIRPSNLGWKFDSGFGEFWEFPGLGLGGRFWGDLGWWDWMSNLDQCVTTMLIRNEPLYKFIFEPFSLPLRSSSLQIPWNRPKFPIPGPNLGQGIVDGPTGQLDPKCKNMKVKKSSLKLFLNWNDLTQNKMTHSLPRPNWFQVTSKKWYHQTFSQWHKRQ